MQVTVSKTTWCVLFIARSFTALKARIEIALFGCAHVRSRA